MSLLYIIFLFLSTKHALTLEGKKQGNIHEGCEYEQSPFSLLYSIFSFWNLQSTRRCHVSTLFLVMVRISSSAFGRKKGKVRGGKPLDSPTHIMAYTFLIFSTYWKVLSSRFLVLHKEDVSVLFFQYVLRIRKLLAWGRHCFAWAYLNDIASDKLLFRWFSRSDT